jgi:cyclophilin family peptidyl-prolyl cis-trans isomerase
MKSTLSVLAGLLIWLTTTTVLAESNPQVRIQTNQGDIIVELYPAKAPKSVANFLQYVDGGFYNNTIFHRVIENFMIQGGGYTPEFVRKETQVPIMNEADNGLKNDRGTVAMARLPDPHSATAQFFINVTNNTPLNHAAKTPRDWGFCVFGKVIKGMDVVDTIRKLPTGRGGPFATDVPQTAVIITTVSRVTPAAAPAKKKGK